MTGAYLIAIVFGAVISLGLYFILFWPGREPDDAPDEDTGGAGRGDDRGT